MGRYEIRPLGTWLDPVTTDRKRGTFRAPWTATLKLLERETEWLGATLVVLQIDVTEGEIRRDGMLYARTRVNFPAVRVSFGSHHGPLTYATDTFDHWQTNVRAIALALSALRAVDRYGATKRGEQYTGWKALPPAGAQTPQRRREEAAQLLSRLSGGPDTLGGALVLLHDPEVRARAFRVAARTHHPDRGGDPAMFRRLTDARELLDQGGG